MRRRFSFMFKLGAKGASGFRMGDSEVFLPNVKPFSGPVVSRLRLNGRRVRPTNGSPVTRDLRLALAINENLCFQKNPRTLLLLKEKYKRVAILLARPVCSQQRIPPWFLLVSPVPLQDGIPWWFLSSFLKFRIGKFLFEDRLILSFNLVYVQKPCEFSVVWPKIKLPAARYYSCDSKNSLPVFTK